MKVIQADVQLIQDFLDVNQLLEKIELAGRVCYKSEAAITPTSNEKFIKQIISNGHEAVLEHASLTFKFICDRGVSHEIVRHRIASYCQESTRYCNYSNDKFGNELTFIEPCYWAGNSKEYQFWYNTMETIEQTYLGLINMGVSPQEARAVLPNSLKTEIIATMNMREWRHFMQLRTSPKAHPQMVEVAEKILNWFQIYMPVMVHDFI